MHAGHQKDALAIPKCRTLVPLFRGPPPSRSTFFVKNRSCARTCFAWRALNFQIDRSDWEKFGVPCETLHMSWDARGFHESWCAHQCCTEPMLHVQMGHGSRHCMPSVLPQGRRFKMSIQRLDRKRFFRILRENLVTVCRDFLRCGWRLIVRGRTDFAAISEWDESCAVLDLTRTRSVFFQGSQASRY